MIDQAAHVETTEVISISWTSILAIVIPVMTAVGVLMKWFMSRIDKSSDTLVQAVDTMRVAIEQMKTNAAEEVATHEKIIRTQDQILQLQSRSLTILEERQRAGGHGP